MNKVLVVSWGFPPLLDVEGIQVARYVKYLREYGWHPHVLMVHENTAIGKKIDAVLLSIVPANVKIDKARSLENRLLIRRITYRLPVLDVLPDSHSWWYWGACRLGKKIIRKQGPFQLIYSRACPFTSNLVGLFLKRKTGLPWIAHFSDPWVDSPYFPDFGYLHRRIIQKLENLVVQHADAITFASEYIKEMFVKKYTKLIAKKSFVAPNCYDASIYPAYQEKKQRTAKFTLTYTGKFYGIRSPAPLLQALRIILETSPSLSQEMQVLIVGELDAEYRALISKLEVEKIVSVVEMVPYHESLEYMSDADVLLLVDAPSEGPSVFLPSKLLDYIALNKPILGITPLEGTSADVIRAAGGIVVSPHDIKGIAAQIQTLYERYQNGDLKIVHSSPGVIQSYDVRNTAKSLSQMFTMVSEKVLSKK